MLDKFGLRKVMLAFVGIISIVFFILGAAFFIRSKSSMTNLSAASKNGIEKLGFMASELKSIANLNSNILATIRETDKDSRDLRLEIVSEYIQQSQKSLSECSSCGDIKEVFTNYVAIWSKIKTEHVDKEDLSGAFTKASEELIPLAEKMFDLLDKKLSDTKQETVTEMEATISSSDKSMWTLFISVIFSVVLVFIGGYMFRRAVIRALDRIANSLSSNSNEASSMSESLSNSSTNLAQASEKQAASVEETAASLQELASMVQRNAEAAQTASKLAVDSSETATKGGEQINKLISSMSDISKSSKEVEEIITVIDDIAFQTNLLALNAAVEAARAGEQGRGFAVVADAVRSLAQKSAEAAKEIGQLIQQSVQQIENGTKTADQSGKALNEIIQSIQKMTELNKQIAQASDEQSTGIQHLTIAMNDIDNTIQTNAATSAEVTTSSELLKEQAQKLRQDTSNLAKLLAGASAELKIEQFEDKKTKDEEDNFFNKAS